MSFLPNRPRSEIARKGADPDTVYWPLVDELFDYDAFLAGGPIAEIPEASRGTQVAVIGAGAGGMCAAYELLRAGLLPVVFEASDRIGGRGWSRHFGSQTDPTPEFAEMGSMRVPPENKLFWRYADAFGLEKQAFPDPGVVPTLLYYENEVYEWNPGGISPRPDPPGPFKQLADDFDAFIQGLMADVYAGYTPSFDKAKVQAAWQKLIDRYRDKTYYEAVVEGIPHWTGEDLNAFGALGMGSGGFGPLYGVCFLEMLRLFANQFESNQQGILNGINGLTESGFYTAEVTWIDGTQQSLQSLGCVNLNRPVTAIGSVSGQSVVNWDGGSQAFEAVIVATTTRAMEFIGLTSPPNDEPVSFFPEPVKVGIRNLHLMESSKLFILTETKFWKDGSLPSNIQTDELPRGLYCLDYPDTDRGVVLISYTWGDDSAKLLSLTPAQRLAAFKEVIAEISPEFAAGLVPVGGEDGILNVDWEAEPYFNGAFKLDSPGQERSVQDTFFQYQSVLDASVDRGVYLAGDSVSWAGGWTEGALHTGINAACAAARRLGGTFASPNPLEDMGPDLYDYGTPIGESAAAVRAGASTNGSG